MDKFKNNKNTIYSPSSVDERELEHAKINAEKEKKEIMEKYLDKKSHKFKKELDDLKEDITIFNKEFSLDDYDPISKKKTPRYESVKEIIAEKEERYDIISFGRKKRGSAMKTEIAEYVNLIENSLFDEAFELLEKNTAKQSDQIKQKLIVRTFFENLFEEKNFATLLEENKWGELATSLVNALERPFFEDIKNRFSSILKREEASKITSNLILENKFDVAKFFLHYADKDLSIYEWTIDEIVSNNNITALRFVCENFENIHFNSDELLAKTAFMKPNTIKMLIEEFDFSLNEQSRLANNLVVNLIASKNYKSFDWLNKHYASNINYSIDNIYKLIERNGTVDFYSIMLENQNLKPVHLEKIGNYIFSPKNIPNLNQSVIYERFFSHNNFDEQFFTLGQGYFVYGLLSKIGTVAKHAGNDATRSYVRILDTYLKTYIKDSVPDAPQLHIVGAAVQVAKVGDCQSTTDACVMVMRRFGKYVNKPNPSGLLPIEQVEKESNLYRVLLNNGAVPPEPEPTFWTNVFNVFRGKKDKQQNFNEEDEQQNQPKHMKNSVSSISSIRVKMRNDFRVMREYLSSNLCDPSIKMKCENMFLKADRLSMVMEKNNLSSFTDELHFLSENFSNYLQKSLKSYIELVDTVKSLDEDSNSSSKLEKAKKMCTEHVELLTEQLDLITSNISNGLSDTALSELRVRGKFLEERFNQSIKNDNDNTLGVESVSEKADVVQVRPRRRI